MRKSIFLAGFADTDTPGTDAHLVRTRRLAGAVTRQFQTLHFSSGIATEHTHHQTASPFSPSQPRTLNAFPVVFSVSVPPPRRGLARVSMCSAPVVPCRNPCPSGSRLAALSVDGASQNVQVARRPPVRRGNWLPVALFPGKRTLLAPSITRTARLFDASAAEESGWLHIGDYLLVKLRRLRRFTCSFFKFFLFFATPALNKTAD